MKRVVFLFLLVFLTACGKNDKQLIVATEAGFAPYEYYEAGEIVGVDIDIAREIAKKLNKELVIKDVAFDSIINEVKSGKADIGAAGISYDAERALEVDFSINYTTSNQVVIVKKDGNIKKISDIKDQKIAVQLGTIADSYLTKNFPDVELVREKKYLAAIEDLKSNKCEAVVMDELPAKAILKNNPSLVILDGWLTSDSYGMIVKKGNKELLEVINEVLKELSEQGKIDSYIIKHKSNYEMLPIKTRIITDKCGNLAQEKTLAPCKRMENLIKKVLRAKPLQAARQRSIIKLHFKKEGDLYGNKKNAGGVCLPARVYFCQRGMRYRYRQCLAVPHGNGTIWRRGVCTVLPAVPYYNGAARFNHGTGSGSRWTRQCCTGIPCAGT